MSPNQQNQRRGSAPLHRPKPWVRVAVIALVILLAVGSVGFLLFDDSDDSGDVTAGGSSSSTGASLPQTNASSAAGKPCVAVSSEPPPGAPAIPVRVGAPPAELVTEDLVVGTGADVAPGATVTVDYIGASCSTGVIFDSSYSRGQTATFGLDEVIQGWGEGIPGMKVGGTRLLGIPPDLGYGDVGSPPDIAPGETLWFVVTVHNTE